MQLRLLHASEISHGYSQKLLVMTDKDKSTEDQVKDEYSLDPDYSEIVSVECLQNSDCMPDADSNTVLKIFGRLSEDGQTVSGLSGSSLAENLLNLSRKAVPLFSLDDKTTTEFQHSFLQTLMIHGIRAVIEMNQRNRQIYKVINEPDSVSRYEIPQEKVEHTTQYGHQHILVMENEKVVKRAAQYLYQKDYTISSVYGLDENQRPKLLHGDSVPLTEKSRLVVVGHGVIDNCGEMTLSGYKAKEVANIIKQTNRVGNQIKEIHFVACGFGSAALAFAEAVLKELHAANIKTEFHFHLGKVQVTSDGKIITQATDGAQWRHKDDTQKVVAVLDKNRKVVITKNSNSKGEVVSVSLSDELIINNGKEERGSLSGSDKLIINKEIGKRFKDFQKNWPEKPEHFLDPMVMENSDPTAFLELMALTWAIFHKDRPLPHKVNINNVEDIKNNYRIMKHAKRSDKKVVWIESEQEIEDVLSNCYEIKSGEDIINIIQHYAKNGENKITYLMVNGWIYAVDPQNLYVYLYGKKLDNNQIKDTVKINEIENCIEEQFKKELYQHMRKHILDKNIENPKDKYIQYIKAIFLGEPTTSPSLSIEAWRTTYFTASIISESARNFRTFPLILMALEMTDSTDNNIREKGEEFFFKEHPMARGRSWVDPSQRGHRGTARAEGSSKLNNPTASTIEQLKENLEMVVGKEVKLYQSWNQGREEVLQEILRILVKYNVIQDSEKESIEKDYIDSKDNVKPAPASGPLGRYNDDHTTTQDLMSASKLENSLRLESHFSRLKASVADQVHAQLKRQYRENLAQMHFQEGSARIEDGEFIVHLVSEGVEPVEFRVKLSPESKFYNEKMSKGLDSTVHDLENHSYIGNILWSVAKNSTFVLLVILTIRKTDRDSKLRNKAKRTEDATSPTKKKPKEQKRVELITLVVVDQEGSVVRVQIELFTLLGDLMITYNEQHGFPRNSVRFYYQDCRLKVTDTPWHLGMENEATIEVNIWANGG